MSSFHFNRLYFTVCLIGFAFLLSLMASCSNPGNSSSEINYPTNGIVDTKPASHWYEALITGNGDLGAMVMGRVDEEQIILSRSGLFLPWEEPILPPDTASHLAEIRQMLFAGQYQKAADYIVELAREENPGYDHKRWTDPLIPACNLRLKTNAIKIKNYYRSVDYQTGEVIVRWQEAQNTFERKLFISRAEGIGVMEVCSPSGGQINFWLSLEPHPMDSADDYWQGQEKQKRGIGTTIIGSKDGWLWYRCSFALARSEGSSLKRIIDYQGYEVLVKVAVKGGRAEAVENKLLIEKANRALILFEIRPLPDFDNSRLSEMETHLNSFSSDNYDSLLARHMKLHTSIYNRVKLDVGGNKSKLTADELMVCRKKDKLDPTLLERIFYADRYTILSSSGQLPPTLQGIWTGIWGAPWSSDYTLNGNLQTAILQYLPGNMPELMSGFFNYIEALVPQSRINAQRLYGCRGILIASRTSTFGVNNHFDRTWPMTFWTAGAGWLAHFFYEYYQYTGDKEFLLTRALPLMKEAALFYQDFLIKDSQGLYVFNPSYSPENAPKNSGSQACLNATMDIAVARELFHNLIEISQEFNVEQENLSRWKEILNHLPPYLINEDGALKEWATPELQDNYEHRHASHLYPLFYGLSDEMASSSELRQAAIKAIKKRIAYRQSGGDEMAFGLVQLAQASISLKDKEDYAFALTRLLNNYHFRVLNPAHNRMDIFNVDIAGGLPAIIITGLINFDQGQLNILPVFPVSQLPEGKLQGVRTKNQIFIDSLQWSPEKVEVVLHSEKDQFIDASLPRNFVSARIDGKIITPSNKQENLLKGIELKKGKTSSLIIFFN
jgi:alpha-L-fucosidase 2